MSEGMHCVDCPEPGSERRICDACLPSGSKGEIARDNHLTTGEKDALLHVPGVDVEEADLQVTRYLCCAAQADPFFAQSLFSNIIRQPRRGIAMSPGVNITVVLKHACAGRQRRALRDFALTVVNLPALGVALGSIVFAAATLSFETVRLVPWALGILFINTSLVKFVYELNYNRTMTGPLSRDRFSEDDAPTPYRPTL
jgi:hypothetical protein